MCSRLRSPTRIGRRLAILRDLEQARRSCGDRGSALTGLSTDRRARVGGALDRALACVAGPVPPAVAHRLPAGRPIAAPAGTGDGARARLEACLVAAAAAVDVPGADRVTERVAVELLEVTAALDPARPVSRAHA